VHVVETVPLTSVGKIDRKALRVLVAGAPAG
jgi:non-ribosomal peptide synthetase component E (peptide arylation enzyme)